MSHWTKIKTSMKNIEYVKAALKRLDFTYEEGKFVIRQYGQSETAQIRLAEAVGLARQKDGTWAMIGDVYHVRSNEKNSKLRNYYSHNDQFQQDLSTAYAIEETKSELESAQFFCTENEQAVVGQDGKITMVFSQY